MLIKQGAMVKQKRTKIEFEICEIIIQLDIDKVSLHAISRAQDVHEHQHRQRQRIHMLGTNPSPK